MIADLTVLPIGRSPHISTLIAEILQDIRDQDLRHQMTATGACLEGTWEQIMQATKRAHAIARRQTAHVVTLLKIEDDAEATNPISGSTSPIERKAPAPVISVSSGTSA